MTLPTTALEGLLRFCDHIRDLKASATGHGGPDESEQARSRFHQLRSQLFAETPARHRHPLATELDDAEVLVLALLFHRRLSGRNEPALGSELTGLLRQAGFSPSTSLAVLDSHARLRASGWLQAQRQGSGFDPLDTLFRSSAEGLSLFWHGGAEAGEAESQSGSPQAPPGPYRDEEELLWDLYAWRALCLQRADALFPNDGSAGPSDRSPRLRKFRREARGTLVRIRERLAQTPGGSEFAIERFRRKHDLGSAHLLTVLHLLFCELVEGEPYISALECLRLVAETRTDLLRQRRMIGPRGKLRRLGIVVAGEGGESTKPFATDLTLADWSTEEMLGDLASRPRFDDEELDEFLRGAGGASVEE